MDSINESPSRIGVIITEARRQLESLTNFKFLSVVEAQPHENGWNVKIEMIEREAIPNTMDLLGLYDVSLDAQGTLIGYSRIAIRKRNDSYQ